MAIGGEQRDGGTLGREGKEGGTWQREGGGAGTMERERHRRSLGRDGSLSRHCDLHGAELVQVAERQLSQIQHVHGYVTHSHITPAQVTGCRWLPAAAYMWCARLFASSVGSVFETHSRMTRGEAGVWSVLVELRRLYFATWFKHLGPDVAAIPPGECLTEISVLAKSLSTVVAGNFPFFVTSYVTKSEQYLSFWQCWFQGKF